MKKLPSGQPRIWKPTGFRFSGIAAALILWISAFLLACAHDSTGQYTYTFEKKISKYVGTDYLLYLPQEYHESQKEWPLVVFLHGSGAAGTDIRKVHRRAGPPKLVAQGKEFPFILLSPQHKSGTRWSNDYLEALLDQTVDRYRVDTDRIYLTGLSGGGRGAWSFAMAHPDRFAALAVISARSIPEGAPRIKHLPIWVFHGAKDPLVPLSAAEKMVQALNEAGADVQYTVYPEAGHNAWTRTYKNPGLYEWMLSHTRGRH